MKEREVDAETLLKLSVEGNAVAQFTLGLKCLKGCCGFCSDLVTAVSWLDRSARNGFEPAQAVVAQIRAMLEERAREHCGRCEQWCVLNEDRSPLNGTGAYPTGAILGGSGGPPPEEIM